MLFEVHFLAVWWQDLENLSDGLSSDGLTQQWATLSPRYEMSPKILFWKSDFSADHQWHHLLWALSCLGRTDLKKLCRAAVLGWRETLSSCCLMGLWACISSAAPLSEWTLHFSAGVAELQIRPQLEAQLWWDKDLGCLNAWSLKDISRVMAAANCQDTKISLSLHIKAFSSLISLPSFTHT